MTTQPASLRLMVRAGFGALALAVAGLAHPLDVGSVSERAACDRPAEEAGPSKPRSGSKASADKVEEGEASWYGAANHGKKTASGERFDPNAPTAAHPTLPLGTEIEVTNLENGRETTLTVNDRGPHTKNRVLDVSKKEPRTLVS